MASQPTTSNINSMQPGPRVFCCQNILNQTPTFAVAPNPDPSPTRQREDRRALQELSSQSQIIMAFGNIRESILSATPLIIQIQDPQIVHRFFASTPAEAGTANRTWTEIHNLRESSLQNGFDRSPATPTTGTLTYQCAQHGQNGGSYLASFWRARMTEQESGPTSTQGSQKSRVEEMIAERLAQGG